MLHPLFSMLVRRPDLVANHAMAYGALVHQEVTDAGSAALKKFASWTLAALALSLSAGLAGVALMVGTLHNQFHWILVAVPSVPLLVGCYASLLALRPLHGVQFEQIKLQLDNDLYALRSAMAVPK